VRYTIASGNTFGARLWTDGKREAPMMPDQPWLIGCPHCAASLWIDELPVIKQIRACTDLDQDTEPISDALPYVTPALHDYLGLLTGGISDPKKCRYLRLRAWWAGNDGRRKAQDSKRLSTEEVANLNALAAMLNESEEEERLMKAEAMRELERYDDAAALLALAFRKELHQPVAIIKALVDQKVAGVRELRFR
jgi:hypothetical protein